MKERVIALKQCNSLLLSHQNYFPRYIYTAKGADTKAGRIVNTINAMHQKLNLRQFHRLLELDYYLLRVHAKSLTLPPSNLLLISFRLAHPVLLFASPPT